LARGMQEVLEPRKSPVQARSTASVDAILQATLQVLLAVGKEQLTTTKVAARAGVSVGTLYQYFPNKSSLLQAVLRRHMEDVFGAVEQVCQERRGATLAEMSVALVDAFLVAKMRDGKESVALYAVSSDIDGVRIVQEMSGRSRAAITAMLESASDGLMREPGMVASMILATMSGASRRLLESVDPVKEFEAAREELRVLVRAYAGACRAG
jgi:AcrR family transcriptional regulator